MSLKTNRVLLHRTVMWLSTTNFAWYNFTILLQVFVALIMKYVYVNLDVCKRTHDTGETSNVGQRLQMQFFFVIL